jgi:CBS domain containing-hemolysin-like protein
VTDLLALLAAVALLLGNGYFVGAEFALISVRRDRLENVAAGTDRRARSARTVLRAMGQMPSMLAASQLAITVCSLLLGRLGEPAIAHLVERPLAALGLPTGAVGPVALVISLLLVVVAHMLLGEMVPRNIALAGPERAAMLLVPPFLLFTRAVRPALALFVLMARGVLRLLRVHPRDELEAGFTSGELAALIAESQREGLLDDAESVRLTRTLLATDIRVSDVLVPRDELVSLPPRPRVGDVTAAVTATGFSRFPVRSPAGGTWTGYLHVKDVLDLIDADPGDDAVGDPRRDPVDRSDGAADARTAHGADTTDTTDTDGPAVPPHRVRGLPEVRADARLDSAVASLRTSRAHLARAVDATGTTVGLVALEDLVEAFVGTVRDATHRRV